MAPTIPTALSPAAESIAMTCYCDSPNTKNSTRHKDT